MAVLQHPNPFFKDDKNIEKNMKTFLLSFSFFGNVATLYYECFLCMFRNLLQPNLIWWTSCELSNIGGNWWSLHENLSSKLTDGRFEHPARSSDNSVIDRMAAVSGGGIWGSEPHQINMGGLENFFVALVVTQKWDEDSARIKKQSLAYWESRA